MRQRLEALRIPAGISDVYRKKILIHSFVPQKWGFKHLKAVDKSCKLTQMCLRSQRLKIPPLTFVQSALSIVSILFHVQKSIYNKNYFGIKTVSVSVIVRR